MIGDLTNPSFSHSKWRRRRSSTSRAPTKPRVALDHYLYITFRFWGFDDTFSNGMVFYTSRRHKTAFRHRAFWPAERAARYLYPGIAERGLGPQNQLRSIRCRLRIFAESTSPFLRSRMSRLRGVFVGYRHREHLSCR